MMVTTEKTSCPSRYCKLFGGLSSMSKYIVTKKPSPRQGSIKVPCKGNELKYISNVVKDHT